MGLYFKQQQQRRPTKMALVWLAGLFLTTMAAAYVPSGRRQGAPRLLSTVNLDNRIQQPSKPVTTRIKMASTAVADELTKQETLQETSTDWIHESFHHHEDDSSSQLLSPQEHTVRPFPFGMVVGMDDIKQALILAAINPHIGGVVISGRRGTGKSVLARAMQRLVPQTIEKIKGSRYNVDTCGTEGVDSLLQQDLLETSKSLQDYETEHVPTPFVQIPLNAMEDSLLGTVDLEASMELARPEFSPGLLARAHRGILYVDEINLLDEEAANILLNVIADGHVRIEREGLSLEYPCKPLLIATYNPQEGDLRQHLLDRIGVALSADLVPLDVEGRVRGVENVLGFSGGTQQQYSEDAQVTLQNVQEEERKLQEAIASARLLLPQVKIDSSQILYLCEEATGAGCEGQRAEIYATEVAKASAAVSANESL